MLRVGKILSVFFLFHETFPAEMFLKGKIGCSLPIKIQKVEKKQMFETKLKSKNSMVSGEDTRLKF